MSNSENEAIKKENKELVEKNEQLKGRQKGLTDSINTEQARLDSYNGEIENKKNEANTHEVDADSKLSILDSIKAEIREWTGKLNKIKEKYDKKSKEYSDIKTDIEAAEVKHGSLLTSIKNSESFISDKKKKELDDFNKKLSDAKSELVKTEEGIELEKSDHSRMVHLNKVAKESYDKVIKDTADAQTELDETNKKISDNKTSLNSVDHETLEKTNNLNIIKDTISDLDTRKEKAIKDTKEAEEASKDAKEEYKREEAKLFSIGTREQSLNEREEFIKEKFKQAGVRYG